MTTHPTIVVAPNAFKGSISADEAADAIALGIRDLLPLATVLTIPVADGGNGTIDALTFGARSRVITRRVAGPLPGTRLRAGFALVNGGTTAIIEIAGASGLHLVSPRRRDPRITTSRGTGELILRALDLGVREILIGLGGSATVDGGTGMMATLGVRFIDETDHPIADGGGALRSLSRIDVSGLDRRMRYCRLVALADVDTPLIGPRGAALLFGPQKGASLSEARSLDRNLRRLAAVIKRDLHRDVRPLRGGGAAGGVGASLNALCGARVVPGAEYILRRLGFDRRIAGADLVVTGEGRIDRTTLQGKAPSAVIRAARRRGIPVAVVAGTSTISAAAVGAETIASLTSLAGSHAAALRSPKRFLRIAASETMRRMFKVR